MEQGMQQTKNYLLMPDIMHKQDLWAAKKQWVEDIHEKGLTKRGIKYTTILKLTQ